MRQQLSNPCLIRLADRRRRKLTREEGRSARWRVSRTKTPVRRPAQASDDLIAADNKETEANEDEHADTTMADSDIWQRSLADSATQPISDNRLHAPDAPPPKPATTCPKVRRWATPDGTPADLAAPTDAALAPANTRPAVEQSARSHLIEQHHAIILFSYRAWFDMHDVHNIGAESIARVLQ
ncbi:SWI/SNF and RSC complex subunit Ssr2 [Friedmanniomyces endolithicus]|nr:SWI/SNF and RSC complex subunit Ssr2 [Friedmanniomyces endolithicus]KAK0791905.1 SWI/SNF and RSC complex subunit Ssr2 [Friedmanniomyces endolithicus]KAK0806330.1 SWI/SNF and RSC complex subunit Ssr2 [Friedmanniomyces endolithicus]KAK0862904.1 SWI/SNF and RSC complex subunit Ssr2 [Friedmanniomyces endolithicus]